MDNAFRPMLAPPDAPAVTMPRFARLSARLREIDDADAHLLSRLIDLVLALVGEVRAGGPTDDDPAATDRPDPFFRDDPARAIPADVASYLRTNLGPDKCAAWFGKVDLVAETDSEVQLAAPDRFVADHVAEQFGQVLLAAWRLVRPSVRRVDVIGPVRQRAER